MSTRGKTIEHVTSPRGLHQAAPIQLRATIQSAKVYQCGDCSDKPRSLRHPVPISRKRSSRAAFLLSARVWRWRMRKRPNTSSALFCRN